MILHFLVRGRVRSKSAKYTYPVVPTPSFPLSTSKVSLEPNNVDFKCASPLNSAVLSHLHYSHDRILRRIQNMLYEEKSRHRYRFEFHFLR